MKRSVVLALLTVCCVSPSIFAQGAPNATAQSVPSVQVAFQGYCQLPDSSTWFCSERASRVFAPLSEAHKWEVLNGYCFDEPGRSRPPVAARISQLQGFTEAILAIDDRARFCREVFSTVEQPLQLQFDHVSAEWGSEIWGGPKRRVTIDPATRLPTAFLAPKDQIGIVVTRTNPLVYVASRGAAKEDNIDQFDSMAKLIAIAGGAVPGILAGLAARPSGGIDTFAVSPPPPVPPTPFEADAQEIVSAAAKIKKGVDKLRDGLDRFAALRSRLQLLAQRLESGPAIFTAEFDEALERPEEWAVSFEVLRTALEAPPLERCEAVFAAFVPIATLDPEKANEIHAAAIRFLRLRQTSPIGAQPACTLTSYAAELETDVKAIRDAASAAAVNPQAVFGTSTAINELRLRQTYSRTRHLDHALALVSLTQGLGARRGAANEMLEKEEATRKAAMALASIATRARDASFRRIDEGMVVSDRLFVEDETYVTSWAKVRTTALNVALSSPYADQVTPARPKEIATSYRMARRGSDRFGVGVGIIYTDVSSPTFVAADPDPSSNTTVRTTTETTITGGKTTTDVTQPELKQIALKDSEPRAGQLAIFATFRLLGNEKFGFGPHGGVGLSTDKPSFHGGGVFNVSKWLMFGGGVGRFRLKALGVNSNGVRQQIGDLVGSTDDIKVENVWTKAGYAIVSLNVLGLPVFTAK